MALNCQNNAAVTGTGCCTGGITSDLYPSGEVYNCVNLGKITGGYDLNGGITGGSTSGDVANCVNFGNVTGSSRCGAIAGEKALNARRTALRKETGEATAKWVISGGKVLLFK